jgi:ketosteroid isomerase-like protein
VKQSRTSLAQKRRKTLEAFAHAWAEKNVDALLQLMTDDCVYGSSVGPEPGQTYKGKPAVRAGILSMFAHDDGTVSSVSNLMIGEDHAYWEWHYSSAAEQPTQPRSHGCDLFLFKGEKIALKQAFRKVWSE